MDLKDSFKVESIKDSFNKHKTEIFTNVEKVFYIFKNRAKGLKLPKLFDEVKTKVSKLKALEAFSAVKSKILNLKIEKLDGLSKNTKIGIGAGILGVAVISGVLLMNLPNDVYKVTIAGEYAGYVSEEETVTQTLEEIKADLSKKMDGAEIVIDDNALTCKVADKKEKEVSILTSEKLKQKILKAGICKANAWAVNINGANVVAAATHDEAESILAGVKSYYQTDGAEVVSAEFKENVLATQTAISVGDIEKPEAAIKFILTGSKEPKTYAVQSGDTIWDIATANGMSPYELQEANPGFDPAKLKIGQQLNLFKIKPYVTVVMKEVVAATENIDYKTVYETTNTLYKGEIKVKTAGTYGTKEIQTEITKENGVFIAEKELGSKVVAEPQNQVALKGTKSLATFTGSGMLSSPVGHVEISSAFGSRGGGRHTGVDLRNPRGTPIRAADDGVVIFAAYSGTYGNIIKLSHGNGLETWYAHCDTMSVSVGQVVNKGETIATVGRTGRATGYHLHFEVRKNGVPQNPINYL